MHYNSNKNNPHSKGLLKSVYNNKNNHPTLKINHFLTWFFDE